jgi:hypothetical protein
VSFISTITSQDLTLLRGIVRKVHLRHVPKQHATDKECDKLIESLGPEIVQRMIRFGVDKGLR